MKRLYDHIGPQELQTTEIGSFFSLTMQQTAYEWQLNGHHRPWHISLKARMACC